MTAKNLFVKSLTRFPTIDQSDDLTFTLGVNVIVGPPNTGKTKWLNMLDYLMGNPDRPEDAFGEDLSAKYEAIRGVFDISGEEIIIERRWKEHGTRGKVFINGQAINAGEFSSFILDKLNIPILRIPKGNPYGDNTWPELSWRMLLRHIYRQQRFWGDFADKQPEKEQLACLLQFLGIAEHLYSEQYNSLVLKRKQIMELQGAKKQFAKILSEVSKEIINEEEVRVSPTVESLDQVIARINGTIAELQSQRDSVLRTIADVASAESQRSNGDAFHQLSDQWSTYQTGRDKILLQLNQATQRLDELQKYKSSITAELGRLSRARIAGRIFGSLKVTHCPVCDQPVHIVGDDTDHCYLCHQPLPAEDPSGMSDEERVEFEINQLKGELQEADDLIELLSQERETVQLEALRIDETITRIEVQLKPVRRAAAAILPPEIGVLDMEVGRLQERVRQLDRIKGALNIRDELSKQIDYIQAETLKLEAEVIHQEALINFAQSADVMVAGMNTYLNSLSSNGKRLWSQGEVDATLNDRTFQVAVGGSKWSTILGGTLMLYFLVAYHYALLGLTNKEPYHYPGIAILDFPPTLEDGATVADKENYILEPFIRLLSGPSMNGTQIIAAGAAFEGLPAANRIELTRIWRT